MQRSRATPLACRASSSNRSRENVVACATSAISTSPAKNRIHKNRRRSAKLISFDLQRPAGGGLIEIGVLNEERARARQRARRNLQREVNDAEPRGLLGNDRDIARARDRVVHARVQPTGRKQTQICSSGPARRARSEEHTSELQSPCNLVCRLLLEKKKKTEYNV